MNDMKQKNYKKIFLAIFGACVLALLWIYLNNYLTRSKATGDAVTISFSPQTIDTGVGQNKSVDLLITTQGGKKISGVDLNLQAQGNIKIVEVFTPVPVSSGDVTFFSQIVRNKSDTQARIAYTASKPEGQLPEVVKVPIIISGTANGTGTLKVDQSKTQIVGTAIGNSFTFGQVDDLNVTLTSVSGPTPTVAVPLTGAPLGAPITLKFDPNPATFVGAPANEVHTSFKITNAPAGAKISAFTVDIAFDPSLVSITTVGEPDQAFTKLNKEINNTAGHIKLGYFSTLPAAQLPSEVVIPIVAQAKKNGSGTFTIAPSSLVAGTIPENGFSNNIQNGTYTIQMGSDIVTGSPLTPTPIVVGGHCVTFPVPADCITPSVSTANLTLNLKLRFQGITRKPNITSSIPVAIRLAGPALQSPTAYQIGQFTPSDDGFWSGSVSFNVPPGGGYRVYIKGPKHLAKKICVAIPTETAAGTYRCSDGNITLSNGVNNIVASQIVLLAGDLPEQGTTGQNGVVDAYDISFVRNNLGSTDPKALAVGDLNLDGIVDSQDFSLILASLSVKYDEE